MNDTRLWVADLLAQFSGQENTLIIPRAYIDVTGSIEDALLLSQIIYWTDRTKMENGWFAKSYAEWTDEIALSKYQVVAATKRLKDAGIETMVKKFNGYPTVHYRLRKDVFELWIVKKLDERKLRNFTNDSKETSLSSTESTSETTSEINTAPRKRSERPRDLFYDAIAKEFNLSASGQIVSIRGMMQGNAKRGTWKDCNFDPPVTDPQEITDFGDYMRKRIKDINREREKNGDLTRILDISAPVTIQRWFYDFRAARDAEHPVKVAEPTEAELKLRTKAKQTDEDFARWMQEQEGMPTT